MPTNSTFSADHAFSYPRYLEAPAERHAERIVLHRGLVRILAVVDVSETPRIPRVDDELTDLDGSAEGKAEVERLQGDFVSDMPVKPISSETVAVLRLA
jgi:hypothetical protein